MNAPPTAPGRARRLKNEVLFRTAQLVLGATRLVPARALPALGRALGRLVHALGAGPRRLARENVARALPALSPAARRHLAHRAFVTLGEELGRAVASLDGRALPPAPPLTDEARALLRAALAEGRGVLFASAHLGPWEDVAARLVAEGLPFVAVGREPYDPRFTGLFERLRGPRGVRWLVRRGAAVGVHVLRALRRGQLVGVPMDLATRAPSVPVPFLGGEAPTAIGPATLALRAGAAVIVGTVAPSPRGLVVTATRLRTDDLGASGSPSCAAHELTRRLAAEIERRILALPEAWPWMHPRFPRVPRGGDASDPGALT